MPDIDPEKVRISMSPKQMWAFAAVMAVAIGGWYELRTGQTEIAKEVAGFNDKFFTAEDWDMFLYHFYRNNPTVI